MAATQRVRRNGSVSSTRHKKLQNSYHMSNSTTSISAATNTATTTHHKNVKPMSNKKRIAMLAKERWQQNHRNLHALWDAAAIYCEKYGIRPIRKGLKNGGVHYEKDAIATASVPSPLIDEMQQILSDLIMLCDVIHSFDIKDLNSPVSTSSRLARSNSTTSSISETKASASANIEAEWESILTQRFQVLENFLYGLGLRLHKEFRLDMHIRQQPNELIIRYIGVDSYGRAYLSSECLFTIDEIKPS